MTSSRIFSLSFSLLRNLTAAAQLNSESCRAICSGSVLFRLMGKQKREAMRKIAYPPRVPHPSISEASFNLLDERNTPEFVRQYYGGRTYDYRTGKEFAEGGSSSGSKENRPQGSDRVNATGTISKAAERIKPDDSRDEDDGSLELKEELSPGSANKQELAKHASKSFNDKVPQEVKDKLHPETVELINNQSGKSATGAGG